MKTDLKDLKTLEVCEKQYELNQFMETEKNRYYYIAIGIRNVLKTLFHFEGEITEEKVNNLLSEALPDDAFLPLVKEITIEELTSQIIRYLIFIKENGYTLLSNNVKTDVKFDKEIIAISADFIFKTRNGIEVVKITRKEPELSYAARVDRNKPMNNIELYFLQLLGEKLYPGEKVFASFHHMESKNDKKDFSEVFEPKKGHNIIRHHFEGDLDYIKEDVTELIKKTKSSDFEKTLDENSCRVCSFANICNYREPQNLDLELIETKEKAPSDFEPTKPQLEAIIFNEGIARINAGAGSGKTTVVALRVVELIINGTRPEDILLITFTNKGAEEMRDKISFWLQKGGLEVDKEKFNIATFNSWGDKIIADNYKELGFTEKPTLIEKVEKYDILFELLESYPRLLSFDYKNPLMDFRYAQGAVSKLSKTFDHIKAYKIKDAAELQGRCLETEANQILEMSTKYSEILKKKNYIEYQDQISLLSKLAEDKDDTILKKYRYEHIIVDEFQDSDSMQIDLITYLTLRDIFKSLMVVGDDSQSIYGFRNTSQENILNFHKMFKEVKDIEIVENFRSTPEIIDLANALNDNNKNKIDKKLISGAKSGEIPMLIGFERPEYESEFIVHKIKELMGEYLPEHIAVISRTKHELFDIEELLKANDIPYILDVPEPLLNNSNIRVANSLATFIDDTKITQGLFEYLFVITNGFKEMDKNDVKPLIKEYVEDFNEILDEASDNALRSEIKLELFFTLLEEIEDKNFKTFFEDLKENNYTFNDLKEYLSKFIEYEDGKTVEKDENKYRAITLTTAHTSKGKEFPVVFATIGKYTAEKNEKSIEEERRTLFVAITRAKEKLYMTHRFKKPNNFSKKYEEYVSELANTNKCRVCRGVRD